VSHSARVRKVFHATPSGRPLSPMRVIVALLRAGFWGSAKNASGPGSLIPGKLVSPPVRTVVEVAEAVRAGERKASEILGECLDAVGRASPGLRGRTQAVRATWPWTRVNTAIEAPRITRATRPARLADVNGFETPSG
jgi:hypothetical protein